MAVCTVITHPSTFSDCSFFIALNGSPLVDDRFFLRGSTISNKNHVNYQHMLLYKYVHIIYVYVSELLLLSFLLWLS